MTPDIGNEEYEEKTTDEQEDTELEQYSHKCSWDTSLVLSWEIPEERERDYNDFTMFVLTIVAVTLVTLGRSIQYITRCTSIHFDTVVGLHHMNL